MAKINPDQNLMQETAFFLAKSEWTARGEDFFTALAKFLAEILEMDYICIDKLLGDNLSARTLAIYYNGKFEDNVSYTLKDTPCGDVVGKTICCFPERVRQLFPKDVVLQDMVAESYAGTTLWGYSGKPIGLIAAIGIKPLKDISLAESILNLVGVRAAGELERRLSEEELMKSEEKFAKAFHNSPDIILITALQEGTIIEVNDSIQRLAGYLKEDIIGKTTLELELWGEVSDRQKLISQLQTKGAVLNFETSFRKKSGEIFYGLVSADLFEISNQKCMLCIIHDVDALKRAEVVLRENESRLKELNITKDKFFSLIAHDLRGPFNSILGFSDLLLEQVREKNLEGCETYGTFINKSTKRAITLLSNLLDWSRLQTGKLEFIPEYFELNSMVSSVIELLSGTAIQKSISVVQDMPEIAVVYADKSMMQTILRNLVSNALKFTMPGGLVSLGIKEQHGMIEITVKDNGTGMAKSTVEKLFRIDQSYSSPGTSDEKGSGLGLILCKEFVEKHGGSIRVASEPGKGSEFSFTIPVN